MRNKKFAEIFTSVITAAAVAFTAGCGAAGADSASASSSAAAEQAASASGTEEASSSASATESAETSSEEAADSSESAAASSESATASSESGSSSGETTTLKLGVVGSIYEDLWAPAIEQLSKEGIDLELVQFSDYVTPNNALDNGEIDLDAFQHQIYLDSDVEANGYKIQTIGYTLIVPLNLFSEKVSSVDEIKDGDTIAIPDDPTNGGRALKVLEAAGLITLKDDADFSPTVDDIETYNKQITIKELKGNTIPSVLGDVTAGIINGNYALDFGLNAEDAIYQDTSVSEKPYWNVIVARTDDLSDPEKVETYSRIVEAFQSDATEEVFNDEFGGYFIKEGWDEDLLADYRKS